MIADEDMVITVTHAGYIKRSPLSLYRAQRRGGKGRTGMTTKDDDFVEHLFVASAHSYVLVFTERGRVYWLKVHEIPQAGPAAQGQGDRQPAQPRRPTRESRPRSRCATSRRTASWSSPPRRARSRRPRSPPTATRAPAASSRINIDEGDRLLAVQRHRRHEGHLPRHRATASSIRFPETDVPADGPRHLRRARHRAAQGRPGGRHGGARHATAPSSPSPSAASASGRRSTSTASRAAAAWASSTSR